jgi:hypothetical protein
MELYKIEIDGDKVLVKALHYNAKLWAGSQWKYYYVHEGGYGTDRFFATDFKTVELAEAWISEHMPR